jgi:hypothetical protein
MPKPQGRCIFCKGFGLSHEHLFSDWLREIFPRKPDDTHTFSYVEHTPGGKEIRRQRQGHSGSKRIRTVCRQCNNGWMSAIDERAKPAATPLIYANRKRIGSDAATTLTVWLSKTAMVGDTIHLNRSLIPQKQRTYLMEKKLPPNGWQVWLASYAGRNWAQLAIYQHGSPLQFTPVAGPAKDSINGYLQTTVIGMGHTFALVIGTDITEAGVDLGHLASFMRRIWPFDAPVQWPTIPIISDNEAGMVQRIMDSLIVTSRGRKVVF